MADDRATQDSDDWLKVLSVVALLSQDVPEGYDGSAAVAALVIVGMTIYSRGVFLLLYFLATGFLIWAAFVSRESLVLGYAALYSLLGVVLIAEGERRRVQKGLFLSASWWAGQALIHGLDIRLAYATGGSSGFFTDLFFVISCVMSLKDLARGVQEVISRPEEHLDRQTPEDSASP